MNDNQLQKRVPTSIKEKGQYLLAFGVVASMLLVTGYPMFVVFFFGVFAYFLLRMFSSGSRSETREIFEFYLTANEILRDDDRRWYGFEINEALKRGEEIAHRMSPAPPLVYFAVGALQNKIGNHKAAITHLSRVVDESASSESTYTNPSPELRSYVRVLRKIEREPADAPLTSAAVRALERARKLRAATLLEDSRQKFAAVQPVEEARPLLEQFAEKFAENGQSHSVKSVTDAEPQSSNADAANGSSRRLTKPKAEKPDPFADRKPISEVLHDIYDSNVQ